MKKKFILISLLSILIMTIGISYAYFVSDITVNKKEMNVSTKRLAIIFTDTKEIAEDKINPGWSTSKSFTVENKSGSVFYYDINIEDLINTFVTTGYLQYKITSTDGGYNMEEFVDIPKSEEARREVLANKIEIGNEEKNTYTIEFRYLNDPNVNQSEDMDCIFGGTLSITESEILVVKYKVNDVIQDEIPNKEEPYVVDKVECSNNAKGIWNEETEKVELIEEVRQTICIVEFKEGHTVNILTSNGEVVSPVSKVVGRIGSTIFTIEEKEGYTLEDAAIVCDNGGEGSLEGNTIVIRNIKQNNTCTVITNPVEVTVTYNVNGGNALSPGNKTVIYTGTYGSLPTATRTGYTFAGWYTAITGGNKVIESTEVTSTVNHTIYARWNANTITLTLNNQSATTAGTGAVYYKYNTATYYSNTALSTTITKITVPSRTGYSFGGYYTAANGGGTQYINASGSFVNNPHTALKANTTLYAKWTANTITVTYDQNGGSGVSPTSNTVTYGSKYKLPTTNPKRVGYTFAGWFTAASGGTQVTTNTTLTNASNHSIYAHWTVKTITVTYNTNGGSTPNPASNKITYGSKYTLAANPTRAGYTFAGWFTAASGGTQVTTSTTLTNENNHTIYAHWNANTITLTLNNQSATSAGTGAVYYKYNTSTYYSNSALSTTITKITVPTKTGYTFGGYYTAVNGGGTQYINASGSFVNNPHTGVKANITLYAKWTVNSGTFTVSNTNPVETIESGCYIARTYSGYLVARSGKYENGSFMWDLRAGTTLFNYTNNNVTYLNCHIEGGQIAWSGYDQPYNSQLNILYSRNEYYDFHITANSWRIRIDDGDDCGNCFSYVTLCKVNISCAGPA